MAALQPVIGFFDNVAEAQQAVQLLLIDGFSAEALKFYTQTDIKQADQTASKFLSNNRVTAMSGRFFFSLFGRVEGSIPGLVRPIMDSQAANEPIQDGPPLSRHDIARRNGTFIKVLVQSVIEAGRATDLLNRAGAVIS